MTRDEMAFGLVDQANIDIDNKSKLRNLITFVIRHVVFKNRHIEFRDQDAALATLNNKIKFKLKELLYDKWVYFKYKLSEQSFSEKYLIENILGTIENGELILPFLEY